MDSRDHSETCEVCGYQRGGLNDLECACVGHGVWIACEMLDRLASNLAIAGALCAAFALGQRASLGINRDAWRPGCGRNAGGGGR